MWNYNVCKKKKKNNPKTIETFRLGAKGRHQEVEKTWQWLKTEIRAIKEQDYFFFSSPKKAGLPIKS